MSTDLRDLLAAWTASEDQAEAELGRRLGLEHGVPLDGYLLVSPDVGMRLARDGVIPERVRISWHLPEKSAYYVDKSLVAP